MKVLSVAGVGAHSCNSSVQEAEAGGLPCSANQSYTRNYRLVWATD